MALSDHALRVPSEPTAGEHNPIFGGHAFRPLNGELDEYGSLPKRTRRRGQVGPIYSWVEIDRRLREVRLSGRHDEIIFVRHGMTKYNVLGRVSGQHDTVLSDVGRKQAHALERKIVAPLDIIFCSSLLRTIQTMELAIPRETRGTVPAFLDSRLDEVNLGELQGRRRAIVHAFGSGDLDFAPLGGESYRHAARRVFSSVIDIFDALKSLGGVRNRRAVVFCHAGVLRLVTTLIRDTKCSRDLFRINLSNAERVTLLSGRVGLATIWLEGKGGT